MPGGGGGGPQGQLTCSLGPGGGSGTPAGTRCGASSPSLAGSPTAPGLLPRAAEGRRAHRGKAGRLTSTDRGDTHGELPTRRGRTHSAKGEGLVGTQRTWQGASGDTAAVAGGHAWNLCACAGMGHRFLPLCGAGSLPLSTSENERGSGRLLLPAANAFRHLHKQTLHQPGLGPLLAPPGPPPTHTSTQPNHRGTLAVVLGDLQGGPSAFFGSRFHPRAPLPFRGCKASRTQTHHLGKLTSDGSIPPPQHSQCHPPNPKARIPEC